MAAARVLGPAAALTLSLTFAANAQVPGAPLQVPAAPLCGAFKAAVERESPELLHVVCGGAGAVLGATDSHELIPLPAIKAALVINSYEGSRRAWLVMIDGDRLLVVEEITHTIAREAGRGATSQLEGLELGFGAPGTDPSRLTFRDERQTDARGEIDLAALIARSRALRAAAQEAGDKQ